MEYRIKAIIAGREVDDSRDMGLDAPYLANAEINMATSLNPMAIGSSASNSVIIGLGNPWKESYDGDEVELFISPLGNTSALELSELEEAVGDATEYEGIDADDTYDDIDDSEEGEDITEEEEAELVESEEENIEAAYLAVNGEDVIIADEETDEEEEAEWISMGKFYVYGQGNNSADNTVRLTCYDMLSRLTDKFEPTVRATTVQALYDDYRAQVMATYGLEVDDFEFNEIYNIDVNWTQPTTYREAIELFAGLVGGFAVIGADNTLGISFYGFNDKVIIDTQVSEYTESSSGEMVLQSITCDRSTQPYKEDKIEVGPGQGIAFANPFVNEEMLADIFAMYNGIRYEGATFKMSWDDSINEGEFLRIMTEEEYKNYVALNNALEAATDAAEILELKGSINSLGKVVLVSNARITLAGDATAKVTSICGTEYAKENPTPSPSTGIFKNLYAEMIQADYIDAVKVVTEGLEAEDAQIKSLVADSLEVGSINGNVIKDGTVIAAALSHEAVQTLSGNHVYYQAEAPTGGVYLEGDTWYKTVIADADTDKKVLHVWNGSEWVPSDFDARVLRANSITAQEIAANTIMANNVNMNDLQANLVRVGKEAEQHVAIEQDGVKIKEGNDTRATFDANGFKVISGDGDVLFDVTKTYDGESGSAYQSVAILPGRDDDVAIPEGFSSITSIYAFASSSGFVLLSPSDYSVSAKYITIYNRSNETYTAVRINGTIMASLYASVGKFPKINTSDSAEATIFAVGNGTESQTRNVLEVTQDSIKASRITSRSATEMIEISANNIYLDGETDIPTLNANTVGQYSDKTITIKAPNIVLDGAVNIKQGINNSPLSRTTHTISNISISAGGYKDGSLNITQSGYYPIAIAGWFNGSSHSVPAYLNISNAANGSATINYRMVEVKNTSQSAFTLTVHVLWFKYKAAQ